MLQPDVSGGRVAPSPGGGDPVSGPLGCAGGGTEQIGLLLLMFGVLYFLMIRPQQKRAKEHDAMMGALKKGDIVRTNGGIRGEITALDERDVTVEVADRTRIKVLRSHIAGLDQPPEPKS
ncbi:MAG: preprotein translocase subunit YajC [Deltaproteobacteria bacterium]|nr:preprotein translocase subunit YajC [Deltaproteobacteria bacterium]MBW2191771.1 preprotein translocase subunit YajC [Deltaproteobacteria bacterium]MBW2717990.1 preprotein translocase subunit YajC [Deltaproteobacteria bacterium]RLB49986.1 MAG: preprotein translocase subunit YajC [Deltaproteobacteria bacterium]